MNKTYTISFNPDLAKVVQKEMKRGKFDNTSEFFRDLVRQRFVWNGWEIEKLSPNDPDYKLSKQIRKTDEFISLSEFLKTIPS